jgi:hypothetical protein
VPVPSGGYRTARTVTVLPACHKPVQLIFVVSLYQTPRRGVPDNFDNRIGPRYCTLVRLRTHRGVSAPCIRAQLAFPGPSLVAVLAKGGSFPRFRLRAAIVTSTEENDCRYG